jgi:hypothetical protein
MEVFLNMVIGRKRQSKCVKMKVSHYRPGQALGVAEGSGSHILRQSAYEGCKVVSPKHRPPLPLFISVTGLVETQGHSAAVSL